MKKKFKVITWILVFFLTVFLAANILFAIFAPRIIETQIEQNLKLKASLSKVSLTLPFTINLERLEIGDFASIKRVSLSPNLIGLLFGKIVIHGLTVVDPVINLVQLADGKLNLPSLEQKGKSPAVYLTSLRVQNGKIIFTDKKIAPEGFQIILDKLNIKISKVTLPIASLAANFSLRAELVNSRLLPFGSIVFDGQLDYPAQDMDADFKVKNLNVVNFAPYYGDFISNKKLASGLLNLSSVFKAKKNDLQIVTDFILSNLIYEKAESPEPASLNLADNALDLFTDENGNLRLEFKIDTKLNNPDLSLEKIKPVILKAAMKNLVNQSPEQLVDKVTTAIDKYKEMGKELKKIFGK